MFCLHSHGAFNEISLFHIFVTAYFTDSVQSDLVRIQSHQTEKPGQKTIRKVNLFQSTIKFFLGESTASVEFVHYYFKSFLFLK